MSKHDNRLEGDPHQAISELIPWYVNGTLENRERERVAQHIAECPACVEEIARCRTIAAVVRSADIGDLNPSKERVARMMARIESTDWSRPEHRRHFIQEWVRKIRLTFEETPSRFRWALAAQAALIVLLAGAVVLQLSASPGALYRTLSDVGALPESGRSHIQVIFAEDITEREMRTLLDSIGATIVSGPSPIAVYTLGIAAGDSDASGRIRETLAVLRAHPKIRLAEPKEP
jgi:anti-sigma factor RsiW